MIHSFDYPALAADALPAARAYAKIAPASPHALHMPSHIFTRLGLWQESIASNLASADAAPAARGRTPSRRDGLRHAARPRLPRVRVPADRRRGRGAGGARGGGRGEDVRRAELRRRPTRSPRSRRAGRSSGATGRRPRPSSRPPSRCPGRSSRTRPRSRTSRRRSAPRAAGRLDARPRGARQARGDPRRAGQGAAPRALRLGRPGGVDAPGRGRHGSRCAEGSDDEALGLLRARRASSTRRPASTR